MRTVLNVSFTTIQYSSPQFLFFMFSFLLTQPVVAAALTKNDEQLRQLERNTPVFSAGVKKEVVVLMTYHWLVLNICKFLFFFLLSSSTNFFNRVPCWIYLLRKISHRCKPMVLRHRSLTKKTRYF